MRKHLMYVVVVALSVAVAACATKHEPRGLTGEYADRQSDAYSALQRANAAFNHKDYATVIRELQPLAQQGNAEAQSRLGVMYVEGLGVAKDEAVAMRLFRQAAAQGYVPAQSNVGRMYAEGLGVARDEAEAARLFRQAAAQGHAPAQNNLGYMYAEGRGVAKDEAEAVRLFRQAAAQGHALAQYYLGNMYAEGRGVARDLAEAQRWYAQATERFPAGPRRDRAIEARDRVARQLAAVAPSAPVSVLSGTLNAEELPLVKAGGVYELSVEINGVLKLPFVLDSGAAEVNMPADVVMTLLRTGTIKETDFLPGATYVLADGSKLKSPRFIIRRLQIGQHSITNVSASVGNVPSTPLLGQSLLAKLGTWGIDNQRQVLIIRPGRP